MRAFAFDNKPRLFIGTSVQQTIYYIFSLKNEKRRWQKGVKSNEWNVLKMFACLFGAM